MAKSAAKKMRDKAVREGKRNPVLNRSPFAYTDMQTRKTKTKKDKLYRCKYRNRFSDSDGKDGSFFGVIIPIFVLSRFSLIKTVSLADKYVSSFGNQTWQLKHLFQVFYTASNT